jgi:hypothetical protein
MLRNKAGIKGERESRASFLSNSQFIQQRQRKKKRL